MTNFFKNTAKKIYKTGYFHNIKLTREYLVFQDCFGTIFSVQKIDFRYRLRIGNPITAKLMMPTYESEYNSLGEVEVCQFIDRVTPEYTDNPDFVLRAALWYIGIN